MLPTTIAGSLPKPAWLAEPERLWAPWQLLGVGRSHYSLHELRYGAAFARCRPRQAARLSEGRRACSR